MWNLRSSARSGTLLNAPLTDYVVPLRSLGRADVELVGGKNSSLGEMLRALARSASACRTDMRRRWTRIATSLREDGLDERIANALNGLDVDDLPALARAGRNPALRSWTRRCRHGCATRSLAAWRELDAGQGITVAVRSSATAEDLPDASFAGQQATYLNVSGEQDLSCKPCTRSSRRCSTIARSRIARTRASITRWSGISVGIQHMVRSDLGASGVMFTLDTDSGFRDVVFITSSYGLGETVVQGAVNPDEFYVYKPALAAGRKGDTAPQLRREGHQDGVRGTRRGRARRDGRSPARAAPAIFADGLRDQELARQAVTIERHYGCPMDIEWAKDGATDQLFIVQARPETVQSRNRRTLQRFALKGRSKVWRKGAASARRSRPAARAFVASAAEIERVQPGDVLVADMTDPDWEPIMKRAAAIVTRRGGRTCHAAIIARELGVPAVVGCGDSADDIRDGQEVTVSCAEGEAGFVYEGALSFEHREIELDAMPTAAREES